MRVFVIGFTSRRKNQICKTSYAQTAQIRAIRKRMMKIVQREITTATLKDVVAKFVPESIGKQIEKACHGIYPLQNVFIRKVKMLKAPKFEASRMMELHGDAILAVPEETGIKVCFIFSIIIMVIL